MRPSEFDIPGTNSGPSESETPTVEALVRDHARSVLALCLGRTGSIQDAEDVTQEVFLKATQKLHTLRNPGRVREWLFRIARRMCVEHYRRRPETVRLPDGLPEQTGSKDPRVERLGEALAKLPPKYAETIALYYLDGRSCAAVADALDTTETAVRQRLFRGRLMLKKLLSEDLR